MTLHSLLKYLQCSPPPEESQPSLWWQHLSLCQPKSCPTLSWETPNLCQTQIVLRYQPCLSPDQNATPITGPTQMSDLPWSSPLALRMEPPKLHVCVSVSEPLWFHLGHVSAHLSPYLTLAVQKQCPYYSISFPWVFPLIINDIKYFWTQDSVPY